MVGKKTWTKKNLNLKIGDCFVCKKLYYANDGGWIINAEKKLFCEQHKEGVESCFDKYLKSKSKTKSVMDW